MRVLLLHDDPFFGGGAEVFLLDLQQRLREQGISSRILSPSQTGWKRLFREVEETDLLFFHVIYYRTSPLLVSLLARKRPSLMYMHDTVHFCFTMTRTLPQGELCQKATGLSCLWRCKLRERRRFFRALPVHWLKRWVYRRLPLILCPSRFTREDLLRFGFSPKRLALLRPYLPLPPSWKRERRKDAPREFVLFVGRPSRGKGFFFLLEALEKLSLPFSAVALGGREERTFSFSRGSLRLLPAQPREKLASWYRRAKVLVMPSLAPESFGFVGLEALYFGTPVIASSPGGACDWLRSGRHGYLVPRGDLSSFREALESLLGDEGTWREFSLRAREDVEEYLDHRPFLEGLLRYAEGPSF